MSDELPEGLSYEQPVVLPEGLSENRPVSTPLGQIMNPTGGGQAGARTFIDIPQSVALGAMKGLAGAGQFAERTGSSILDYAKSMFGDKVSDQNLSDLVTNKPPSQRFSPSEWALNQINAEQEKIQNRAGDGYAGYIPKVAEGVGEVMSPLNQVMAAPGLVGGALSGAGMGALTAAPTGLSDKEYWNQKLWDVGSGGLLGGILGKVLNAPDPDIKKLAEAGVKNIPLGFLGSGWAEAENISKLLPFVRKPVEQAEARALESFNRGVANKVLEPLGISAPEALPVGHKLNDWVQRAIGDEYGKIAPKVQIDFTPTFEQSIKDRASRLGRSMTTDSAAILQREVDDLFKNAGKVAVVPGTGHVKRVLSGETFRQIESNLGSKANELMRGDNSSAGRGLFSVQDMLRKELRAQNPAAANELRAIHDAYINSRPLQKVDDIITNELFTPGQLAQRTKKLKGVDGEMRTLAEAAQRVMGPSGKTTELNPFIPAAVGLGSASGFGGAGLAGLIPHAGAGYALAAIPALIAAGRTMQTRPVIGAANAIRQMPVEPFVAAGTQMGAPFSGSPLAQQIFHYNKNKE